jgi:hypothetical protein
MFDRLHEHIPTQRCIDPRGRCLNVHPWPQFRVVSRLGMHRSEASMTNPTTSSGKALIHPCHGHQSADRSASHCCFRAKGRIRGTYQSQISSTPLVVRRHVGHGCCPWLLGGSFFSQRWNGRVKAWPGDANNLDTLLCVVYQARFRIHPHGAAPRKQDCAVSWGRYIGEACLYPCPNSRSILNSPPLPLPSPSHLFQLLRHRR